MQQRFNNQSFHTLAFIMEHDYAECETVTPRMAAPFQANLDRIDFEQRVPLMSRLYEDHFVRNAVEYLGTVGDGAATLGFERAALYPEALNCGFAARRFEDELVVTQVWEDARVKAGDRIVAVNGYDIPAFAQQAAHVLSDRRGEAAHEIWDVALAFSRHFDVRRSNGHAERLKHSTSGAHPRTGPPWSKTRETACGSSGPARGQASRSSAPAGRPHQSKTAQRSHRPARIDQHERRRRAGPAAFARRQGDKPRRTARFGPFYLWCSPNNCRMTADALAAGAEAMESQGLFTEAEETRAQAAKIRTMTGQDFRLIDLANGARTLIEPQWPQTPVAVLADIATAGTAENLVRIAKLSTRSTVVGRPTRGTLDHTLPLTVALDAAYTVTYPPRSAWKLGGESGSTDGASCPTFLRSGHRATWSATLTWSGLWPFSSPSVSNRTTLPPAIFVPIIRHNVKILLL